MNRRVRFTARSGCCVNAHLPAQDEGELGLIVEAPPRPVFDTDIARLLIRTLARGKHDVFPLSGGSEPARARGTIF